MIAINFTIISREQQIIKYWNLHETHTGLICGGHLNKNHVRKMKTQNLLYLCSVLPASCALSEPNRYWLSFAVFVSKWIHTFLNWSESESFTSLRAINFSKTCEFHALSTWILDFFLVCVKTLFNCTNHWSLLGNCNQTVSAESRKLQMSSRQKKWDPEPGVQALSAIGIGLCLQFLRQTWQIDGPWRNIKTLDPFRKTWWHSSISAFNRQTLVMNNSSLFDFPRFHNCLLAGMTGSSYSLLWHWGWCCLLFFAFCFGFHVPQNYFFLNLLMKGNEVAQRWWWEFTSEYCVNSEESCRNRWTRGSGALSVHTWAS